ncbi:marine proteobacterial sortase target protein [Colwellia sp. 20A7]|uniref:marine proteobacterial sortase target protein n=1 Tax=Colwellia sp. 20A7 TaxID=2689569 RepID=UPI001358E1A8|nr:marine proteobacterial sortase target protein [Colwellia sp. 20A7]
MKKSTIINKTISTSSHNTLIPYTLRISLLSIVFSPILLTIMSFSYLLVLTKVSANELSMDNIPYQSISSGTLYFKNNEKYASALIQKSDYQVTINGLLAKVNFTQTFKNSSNDFVEAVYVFPLVDDASVSSMIMEIGERRIVGKIKEKKQAQKLYIKAKTAGKRVGLVSQQRPNLFTTKVANIAPGESIKINLHYFQSIKLNNETFSLRIPLTLTPRFIPSAHAVNRKTLIHASNTNDELKVINTTRINSHGWAMNNDRVDDASEITPIQTREDTADNNSKNQTVTLSVDLNGGLPLTNVTSLYHQISKTPLNDKLLISLADKNTKLDQDFVLEWQLEQDNVPKAAFFIQSETDVSNNKYEYGLLMLMPPSNDYAQAIDKDVIYIIDTSGSMGGVAIRQAKQSLITALDLLNSNDTFNIISFEDSTQRLFKVSKLANVDNIAQAKYWLSQLEAGGGTNMYPAIEQALTAENNDHIYKQVVFITDGSVGNETELFNLIERKLDNSRLHTIGIGSAPNSYFMSQAAKIGRGTYRYIGSINEVSHEMTELFNQISKPLMQKVVLSWPMADVETFPKNIPDLYSGQPLMISARWLKNESNEQSNKEDRVGNSKVGSTINVSGQLAAMTWQEKVNITNVKDKSINTNSAESSFDADKVNIGVAQWWAKEKIDHLIDLHRRGSIEQKEIVKSEITNLALQHHLLSPYTSFIAIEEEITRKEGAPLKSKAINNLMPKGSTQIIPLANTSLGIAGYLYFALFFMTVAILMQLINKSKLSHKRYVCDSNELSAK